MPEADCTLALSNLRATQNYIRNILDSSILTNCFNQVPRLRRNYLNNCNVNETFGNHWKNIRYLGGHHLHKSHCLAGHLGVLGILLDHLPADDEADFWCAHMSEVYVDKLCVCVQCIQVLAYIIEKCAWFITSEPLTEHSKPLWNRLQFQAIAN